MIPISIKFWTHALTDPRKLHLATRKTFGTMQSDVAHARDVPDARMLKPLQCLKVEPHEKNFKYFSLSLANLPRSLTRLSVLNV